MSIPTIRCEKCGSLVMLKVKAKPRKYCTPCRKRMQDNFKKQVRQARQDRVKNVPVEQIEQEDKI